MLSADDYRVPAAAPDPPRDNGFDAGLPAAIEAEKTILGALLLGAATPGQVSQKIGPDDFVLDSHRRIFLHMTQLAEEGHAIDLVTLAHSLGRKGETVVVGGVAYLASLTEGLPRLLAIDDYLKMVKDKSLLRRVMYISSALMAEAAAGQDSAAQIIDRLLAQVTLLTSEVTWRDPTSVLVNAIDFALDNPGTVDWIVEGIIQRSGNGLIVADGKTGKSLLVIHLLLHLASGTSWLGLRVPRRISCALISREDDPGETARRIASFVSGCAASFKLKDCEDYLWLNTRAQTPTFSLDNRREVEEIIAALKRRQVEFAAFDVFRSMWTGNENDAQEVGRVLEVLRRIQREAGCACCLLHHLRKSDDANMFANIRGSTALRGWQEWGFGVRIVNPEEDESRWVRSIRFETKAARPHRRLCYAICGPDDAMRLELRDEPRPAKKTVPRRAPAVGVVEKGARVDD